MPYGPAHAPFLSATPFLPFPGLNPAIETLAGSRALSALAEKLAAQKRPRSETTEDLKSAVPSKRSKIDSNDPLDLSSTASTTEDDVDILSIDPPSPSNVEQWSIDKVVEFVSNVEACREYAQVIYTIMPNRNEPYLRNVLFRFHWGRGIVWGGLLGGCTGMVFTGRPVSVYMN